MRARRATGCAGAAGNAHLALPASAAVHALTAPVADGAAGGIGASRRRGRAQWIIGFHRGEHSLGVLLEAPHSKDLSARASCSTQVVASCRHTLICPPNGGGGVVAFYLVKRRRECFPTNRVDATVRPQRRGELAARSRHWRERVPSICRRIVNLCG